MSLFNTVNIVRFGGYNRGGRGTEHPLRFFLRKITSLYQMAAILLSLRYIYLLLKFDINPLT